MEYTKQLSGFAAGLRYEDLPESAVAAAKTALLDWLGVAVAGAQAETTTILREVCLADMPGERQWVFGAGYATDSTRTAALVNGAASHALDFDDLHNPSVIHLGTVVIPAAWAVATARGASGRELLTAIVAGFEIGGRVGQSIIPESYHFWHTTGTAGIFGAAAAAGNLYRLDAAAMNHCLGTAGTQAAGLWEFLADGAMSKLVHAGKAAAGGVFAAELAARGFTGATHILEGEKGFCRALSPEPHWDVLLAGLGSGEYAVEANSYKPYPCCRHAHAAIAAALALREEGAEVADVTLHANALTLGLIDNPEPQTAYGCKFSVQYCLACALRDGEVTLAHFSEEDRRDPELRALMQRIRVVPAPDLDALRAADPTKMPARVEVRYRDGRRAEETVLYPPGDPTNPLSEAEMLRKYRSLTLPYLDEEQAEARLQLLAQAENVRDWAAAWRALQ
ncbi:MAG: MmgE/PrpD family protein [Veillonellaceae bacterium]|nr:MmgE/PrpD family protein [Veillonellaceae bacterium]